MSFEKHSKNERYAKFSPDGKLALTASGNQTVNLWDVGSGKRVRVFKGHADFVTSVVFSPDSKYILSGSWDATMRMWDLSGKQVRIFKQPDAKHYHKVECVAFSPCGEYAICSLDANVLIWEVASGRQVSLFPIIPSVTWNFSF